MPVGRRWRRYLRRLLVLIILLGAAYVGLDVAARSIAAHQLANAIRTRTAAQSVAVQVGSAGFLFDLLAHGSVDAIDVQLVDVPVGKLDLAHVAVSAQGVQVDRDLLLAHRRVQVTAISSAAVQVTVTAAELSRAVGHDVVLSGPDTVKVRIGPLLVPATIGLTDGHVLTLGEEGFQLLDIDLATSAVVPRCGMQLTVGRGSATLACTVAPVPASLLAGVSGT
ncbi:MAG TPA: hypothetical protein VEH29_11750 [Acidimicrobiales bacterium]|nr:hypothetical protein [Acidimicrobiales bacterium]